MISNTILIYTVLYYYTRKEREHLPYLLFQYQVDPHIYEGKDNQ